MELQIGAKITVHVGAQSMNISYTSSEGVKQYWILLDTKVL